MQDLAFPSLAPQPVPPRTRYLASAFTFFEPKSDSELPPQLRFTKFQAHVTGVS